MANELAHPVLPEALIDTSLLTRESPLPELSVWRARSTYAALTTGALIIANSTGFHPDDWLSARGMSTNGLIDAGFQIAPLVSGAWAWLERKTPNFKLVWWK